DQALAGGEVGDAATGDGEALAHGCRRVLAFRLEEHERIAPQVLLAVHDRGVEAAAHGRRAGDRVGAGRLGDVDLNVDHRLGPVTSRWHPRVLKLLLNAGFNFLWAPRRFTYGHDTHSGSSFWGV